MRVVLIGDETGLLTLTNSLNDERIKIVAIIFNQERIAAEDVASRLSKEINCELIGQPTDKKSDKYEAFVCRVRALEAELAVCCSYDLILGSDILALFNKGVYNLHGALLPKYRGANVLNWVLINGEEKTGMTIHLMESTVDTGPIALQEEVEISFDDTALSLRDKLNKISLTLLDRFWKDVINNKICLKVQNENEATYVKRRKPEDGYFEWNQPTKEIYNKIRALVKPWPGAWYLYNGERIVIDEFMDFDKVEQMRNKILNEKEGTERDGLCNTST